MCCFELEFPPDICPGVGLLDHTVTPFLVFKESPNLSLPKEKGERMQRDKVGVWNSQTQVTGCNMDNKVLRNSGCAHLLTSVQLWATLGGSPPGLAVHGIFPARILEWVATFYSRESS